MALRTAGAGLAGAVKAKVKKVTKFKVLQTFEIYCEIFA